MNNKELITNGIEIIISLFQSIKDAGGTFIELSNLSVLELLEILSTNKIRFIYKGDKK